MASYLKHPEEQRTSDRVSLLIPNFEYLMLKAKQQDPNIDTGYDFIKQIAINLLGNQMLTAMQILQDSTGCVEGFLARRDLPEYLFNWLGTHPERGSQNREQNLFGLDIIEKFLTPECFNQKKMYNDMEMLQRYFRKLLQSYVLGNQEIINNELEDMLNYLNKVSEMQEELAESKEELSQVSDDYYIAAIVKKFPRVSIEPLKSKMGDVLVENAMEKRFVEKILETAIESAELSREKKIATLQKQIDSYTKELKNENSRHTNSVAMLTLQTYQYRYQIYLMEENYNKMYNKYKGEIERYSTLLTWMKDQTSFYEESIKRFHRTLEDIRLKDEEEAQALRRSNKERLRKAEERKLRKKQLQEAHKKKQQAKKHKSKKVKTEAVEEISTRHSENT